MQKGKILIIAGVILTVTIVLSMGLFNFLKKPPEPEKSFAGPYKDSSTNLIYNLLFCDDLGLYKHNIKPPYTYPFDILYFEASSVSDLQRLIDEPSSNTRIKALAYNRQLASGYKPATKELLAVIVEVGLDNGLDVLASFKDGTARYINQSGKLIVWEATDPKSNELTRDLFTKSSGVVAKIEPWKNARRAYPTKGNVRISFLVSDGFYFGEGPLNVLFNDSMAGPALNSAAQLMQYLTEKTLKSQ